MAALSIRSSANSTTVRSTSLLTRKITPLPVATGILLCMNIDLQLLFSSARHEDQASGFMIYSSQRPLRQLYPLVEIIDFVLETRKSTGTVSSTVLAYEE